MKVVFSTEAKRSLREIALFIARDNKIRAISFVRELRSKALNVGNMPWAFPLIPATKIGGFDAARMEIM